MTEFIKNISQIKAIDAYKCILFFCHMEFWITKMLNFLKISTNTEQIVWFNAQHSVLEHAILTGQLFRFNQIKVKRKNESCVFLSNK